MRKLISVLSAIFCSTMIWAEEDSFVVGGLKYTITDAVNHKVSVEKSGAELQENLVIPAEVENGGTNYAVTSIPDRAFEWRSELKTVTIPSSVTEIGTNIFPSCAYITEIIVDGSNEFFSSEGGVLFNKDKTTLLCYPKGKSGAYTIPNSVTSIAAYAFDFCKGLTAITIKSGVTTIGEFAFNYCSNLTSVTVPNTVTTIGKGAFYDCTGLATLILSNKITTISESMCLGCKLTTFEIPSGVTSIEGYAFYACDIKSLTIPNTVETIGNQSFRRCHNLETLIIPSSVKNISSFAFSEDENLTFLCECEESEKPSGWGDSWNSDAKETVWGYYDGATICRVKVSANKDDYGTVTGSKTVVGGKSVSITAMPTEGHKFVKWSNGLTTANATIEVISDTTLVAEFAETSLKVGALHYEITSPTTVEVVKSDDHKTLTSADIPASVVIDGTTYSVTSIGQSAFFGSEDLKSVTIPQSVTEIKYYAFYNCKKLVSVTIPNSVTSIGTAAFNTCDNLVWIIIPSSVTSIESAAFYHSDNLTIFCERKESEKPSGWVNGWNAGNCPIVWGFDVSKKLYNVTVSANNSSYGSATGGGVIQQGQTTTITATPATGYKFTRWSNNGLTNATETITVNSDMNLVAYFERDIKTWTVKVSANNDEYGTVSGGGTVTNGQTTTIKATPATGYKFVRWSNGRTNASETITVTADMDLVAYFEEDVQKWTVKLSANNDDYGTVSGGGTVVDGQTTTITATPATGCMFLKWNNGLKNATETITVTSNLYLTAQFAKILDLTELQYEITSDSTVKVVYSDDYLDATKIVIPETVKIEGKTYTVTSINSGAFEYCKNLTSVSIPKSVKSIGSFAFFSCSNLTGIVIPDGVTVIGSQLFEDCISLTSVTIPESVTSIAGQMFWGCSSLASITIPERVTSIDSQAFQECSSLTSITIPPGVSYISNNAFNRCYNLTEMNLEGNDYYSFENQTLFDKGKTKLLCCLNSKVSEYTIPNTVKTIGEYAFEYCYDLKSITIPNTVTAIEYSAFRDCVNLTSITLPNSLIEIGGYAFEDCDKLTTVILPETVTSISRNAFYDCNNLVYNEYDNAYYLGSETNPYFALVKAKSDDITTCDIHKDCKVIAYNAFDYCNNLQYNEYDNAMYLGSNKNKYSVLVKAKSTDIASCEINSNCSFIMNSAFRDCDNLTSITIPAGVKSIGDYAFYYCDNLESITFPEGLRSLGEYAFYGCHSLNSVTIPEGVTTIPRSAFSYCWNLNTVILPSSVTSIGVWAFDDCPITEINISESVTNIDKYAFNWCHRLKLIKIPKTVTTIGEDAFEDCYNLIICCEAESKPEGWNVDWNSSNRPVAWGFDLSKEPCTVTLSANKKAYGTVAGDGIVAEGSKITISATPATGYKFVKWSNGLTKATETITVTSDTAIVAEFEHELILRNGLYYYITSDNTVEVAKSDEYQNLTSVTIPGGITVDGVYYWVTSIADRAFASCYDLKTITCYPSTPPTLGSYVFSGVRNCKVYVPCNSYHTIIDAYKDVWGENGLTYEAMFLYSFAAKANDDSMGTVEILRMPDCEQPDAWVKATPKDGYKFVTWDNGSSYEDNKYMSVSYNALTNSKTAVAYFAPADADVNYPPANDAYWYYDETTKTLNIIGYSRRDFGIYMGKGWGGEFPKDEVEHVVMTGEITGLEASTFADFTALKDIVLPPSVSYIGSTAFLNCKNLESIELPEKVKEIEYGAFGNCDKLTKIVLPQSLKTIGSKAFNDCSKTVPMTIVFKSATPPEMETDAFNTLNSKSVFIVPCGSLDTYMNTESWTARNEFTHKENFVYSVSVASSDAEGGTARVLQQPDCGTPAIIEATAAEGYRFVGWSDGETDAKREFEVKKDYNLIAEFVLIGTPIRNISADKLPAKAVKTLIDGRLVIIRDGKMYGITGELIK